MLVTLLAALVVRLHGLVIRSGDDGLCSHCGREDRDQRSLRELHAGVRRALQNERYIRRAVRPSEGQSVLTEVIVG